jgi:creatinine amidohydrolase
VVESSVQLQLKTWQFVEDYLKTRTGIIIPIGSTEQHGPTGLIGTDALTAEMIARGAGEKAGALVAPTISVGMAQHHLAFPGSVTLRPTTLIAVVRDTVVSLARHGFTRFYFVNGHGGNVATVTAAFSEIYAERSMEKLGNQPSIRCALRNWWESSGVKGLSRELYGSAEGSHATPSEVAVTWYGYPQTMQQKTMEPRIAPHGSFADAEDYRRAFPDGRIGSDPNLATPEHGKRIYETAVEDVARDYAAWVTR